MFALPKLNVRNAVIALVIVLVAIKFQKQIVDLLGKVPLVGPTITGLVA